MWSRKKDQLRILLRQRAGAVSDKVIQSEGQVASEQLEELERLARLVKISDDMRPSPKRWPAIAVLGFSLLVVSVLFFARVSETTIELDLKATAIGFDMAAKEPYASKSLSGNIKLSDLTMLGLRQVELPDEGKQSAERLHLATVTDGDRQGIIGLAPLVLPEGTSIHLSHEGSVNKYRLSLKDIAQDAELRVTFIDPLEIRLDNFLVEHEIYSIPKLIRINLASNEVTLDLTFPEAMENLFFSSIYIKNLSLAGVEEFIDKNIDLPLDVSYISSGTLYFKSLNSVERSLRSGEFIHFKHSEGVIQTIQLHEDYIGLRFYGNVRGMTTGLEEFSLMPTYLEWLKARHGAKLFWGTSIYLFGVIVCILRWCGLRIKAPNS